jgi:3-oxoadipate enol-lactonase
MPSARINGINLYSEPEFSRRYRCITFVHRGFGNSIDIMANRPGQESFVEDLKGLLDNLGIERAHLVAQSMGGRTCLASLLPILNASTN